MKSESAVAQLCPTLCDPMDHSLRGCPIHGIFQARVLEWVAIFFSRDLPDPGIKPGSPSLQADAFTVWATREAKCSINGPQILVSLDGNGNVDQVYLTW